GPVKRQRGAACTVYGVAGRGGGARARNPRTRASQTRERTVFIVSGPAPMGHPGTTLPVERMPRSQARFVCQQCGSVHAKWTGRCEGCGAWNSMIEELPREAPPQGLSKDRRGGRPLG